MSTVDRVDQAAIAEVLKAEEERCRLMTIGDIDALEHMLDDDLTYGHLTGEFQRKGPYLEHLREGIRERAGEATELTREGLEVRVLADVAWMTGRLYNHRNGAISPSRRALQVWVRKNGHWLLAAHQTVSVQAGL
jgi:ketosteroid isomerase-like protein